MSGAQQRKDGPSTFFDPFSPTASSDYVGQSFNPTFAILRYIFVTQKHSGRAGLGTQKKNLFAYHLLAQPDEVAQQRRLVEDMRCTSNF